MKKTINLREKIREIVIAVMMKHADSYSQGDSKDVDYYTNKILDEIHKSLDELKIESEPDSIIPCSTCGHDICECRIN